MKNKIKVYDLLKRWKKERFSYVAENFVEPKLVKVGDFWAPITGELKVIHVNVKFTLQLTSISFHILCLQYPSRN